MVGRRARRPARGAPPSGGLDVGRGDRGAGRARRADDRARRRVAGRRRADASRPTLDPGEQPFLDDHRIDGTPVLPGVMGIEAFAEVARVLLPELAGRGASRTSSSSRRSSSTATSRARWSCGRVVRDGGEGTLVADCRLIGRRDAARPGASRRSRPLHAAASASRASCRPRRRRTRRRATAASAASAATTSTASTSTAPPTRCSSGVWRDERRRRRAGSRPDAARRPRARQPTDRARSPADRAVLPDRRRLGARHAGTDGAADRTSSRVARFAGAEEPGRLCGGRAPARRRRRRRRRRGRRGRTRARAARGLPHDRAAGRRRRRARSRRSASRWRSG